MGLGAVLFDLDGTLVDTERENGEAMARALDRGQGIAISQAEREFVVGHSWVEIYKLVRAGHPQLQWTMGQLIAATADERERIFADRGIPTLPGARAAIARFAHVPRAIVTGSSRVEARQSLDHLGVASAFDTILAAEDVPTSKPEPDGYLAAARALGVSAAACLVLEDSSAGIAAGVAAGATVIAVRAGNFMGHDQSAAHHIVDTLDAVTRELAEAAVAARGRA